MNISSLLKAEIKEAPGKVIEYIIEKSPEDSEEIVRVFLQLIIDLMGTDYTVTSQMVRDQRFDQLLFEVSLNLRTDYTSNDILVYEKFMIDFLNTAITNNILQINAEWLKSSIKLFEDLNELQDAQTLVSLLSLPFFVSLTDNFAEMNRLQLIKYWESLFKNIKNGMRYPQLVNKLSVMICSLTERSHNGNLYALLPLYTEGLKIQHFATNSKMLKSINNVFHNAQLGRNEKQLVADYLAKSEPSRILCHLMFDKVATIVEETFKALLYIHNYVCTIPSWKTSLYHQAYFKMFHPKEQIRRLAADLFLKRTMNLCGNPGVVLIEILEFYFLYQPSIDQLPSYIDNLWSFEFMHNFENIFTLLSEDSEESNILACHFIVAVVKKMLTEFDLYRYNILYLLQRIPLILKIVQKEKYPFGILLEVLVIIDINLYHPESIGNVKYIDRTTKILCETFLTINHGFKVQKSILYILDKLIAVPFYEASDHIFGVVQEALELFEQVFLDWEDPEYTLNEYNKKKILESVCNIYVIVSNLRYLNIERILKVYKIMQTCFLRRKYFEEFGETKIRSTAILLISELFKRIMVHFLQTPEQATDYMEIEELKVDAMNFMLFLEGILVKSNHNKHYTKAAYEALISVMLLMQEMLRYNEHEDMRYLCIDVSQERYLLILNYVHQIIDPSQKEYSIEEQKDVLRRFSELHKYHIGIPEANELWKIMIYFGYLKDLEDELFELVKTILNRVTPKENEGRWFSRIFPAIIVLLVEKEENENTIKDILSKYYGIIDGHSSNTNDVVGSWILQLTIHIGRTLGDVSVTKNGVKVLQFITPFLKLITQGDYKEQIKSNLPAIDKLCTTVESSILRDFAINLLSK